jgi:hypothetical protein
MSTAVARVGCSIILKRIVKSVLICEILGSMKITAFWNVTLCCL